MEAGNLCPSTLAKKGPKALAKNRGRKSENRVQCRVCLRTPKGYYVAGD